MKQPLWLSLSLCKIRSQFLACWPPASIVKHRHHFLKLILWALPKCLRLSLTSKYVLTCRWSHFFQMPIVLLWADDGYRLTENFGDCEETGNCQNAVGNISKSMSWISWKLFKEEVLERQLETLVMVTRSSSSPPSSSSHHHHSHGHCHVHAHGHHNHVMMIRWFKWGEDVNVNVKFNNGRHNHVYITPLHYI